MGNKSTFTAELKIQTIISDAQKDLSTFGESLKKAWAGGEPPKGLLKTYEDMRVRLESLKQISKKGWVDTSDLRQAEAEYKSFQKDLHNLSVEFSLFSTEQKKAMLGNAEQENIKARAAAIREYSKVLKENKEILTKRAPIEQERVDLIESQKPQRTKAKAKFTRNTNKLNSLQGSGPALTADAAEYAKTLQQQEELLRKIETTKKRISSLEKTGLKEGGKNQLTESRAELERLVQQQAIFEKMTGKADYEAEMARYAAAVSKAETAIEEATAELADMDEQIAALDSRLEELPLKNTQELLNKFKELGINIDKIDTTDIAQLKKAVLDLDKKALEPAEQQIKDWIESCKSMGEQARETGRKIDGATEDIRIQNEVAGERSALVGRIKDFVGVAGAAQLMRRALSDAFETVKELDAAMTEMAMVTDTDIGGYWDQLPTYTRRANELGMAISDVYRADTLFYQQGLEAEEVVALSTQTIKMAAIAGLDTAEATDRMTAALRGFNMELNETNAQKVADVYSELAAITASDVDEISSAMTKTASIASSAGMEFETTAAFLSQIIETTRESAETAGTAMKTVIARFQELKKDPSEIGEVDGEIVDANKIETALRSVGVALRDSSGQFRDLDDVFMELSKKWNTLDTNTQRYIATIAAGSRQQSRFIAMMSDYSRTSELVTAATNSAGASSKQFEKQLDSMKAKLNQLKNAWDSFTMGIADNKFLKGIVDILAKLITTLDKASKGFNGFGEEIAKLALIFGVFKAGKIIYDKFSNSIIEKTRQIGREAAKGFKEEFEKGIKEEGSADNKDSGPKKEEGSSSKETEKRKSKNPFAGGFEGTKQIVAGIKDKKEGKKKIQTANEQAEQAKTNQYAAIQQESAGREKAEASLNSLEQFYTQKMQALGKSTNDAKASWEEYVNEISKAPGDTQNAFNLMQKNITDAQKKKDEADIDKIEQDINQFKADHKKGDPMALQKQLRKKQEEIESRAGKPIIGDKQVKDLKNYSKGLKEAQEGIDNYSKATQDLEKAQKNATEGQQKMNEGAENTKAGLQNILSISGAVSGALMGAGVAMSFVATAFEDAGMEEQAEIFTALGSSITMLGTVMGVVGPVITFFQGLIKKTGDEAVKAQIKCWPLLIVLGALLAIVGILAAVSAAQKNSLAGRMEAAAEATEKAKQAAQEAQKAYDELLEHRNEYDETQQALEDLTYGTKEWKKALMEANQQVLDLITEYPELAKYMERGAEGQLTISEEGWDAMEESKLQVVQNTQALQLNRQIDEYELKREQAQTTMEESDAYGDLYTTKQIAYTDESGKNYTVNMTDTLKAQLENVFANATEDTEALNKDLQSLADLYGVNVEELEAAGVEITKRDEQMKQIAEQAEAVAKASLMASASQELQDTGFADQVTDIFATSASIMTEEQRQAEVDKKKKELKKGKDYAESAEFKSMADQYGVKLTGNDTADLEKLYKAATGATDEDLEGMSRDQMIEELAEIQIADETNAAMEELGSKLAELQERGNSEMAKQIAGAISNEGTGLSREDSSSMLKDGKLDTSKVTEMATSMGYASAEAWATAMNMTLDQLEDTLEGNAKNAAKAYGKIDERLKKAGIEVNNIAGGLELTLQQTEQIADKLINIQNSTGTQAAEDINRYLGYALETIPEQHRDTIANALGTMNWHDLASWDELEDLMKELGLSTAGVFDQFIKDAKEAAGAMKTINWDEFNNNIANMYDLYQKVTSGEMNREYSKEEYESLVAANEDLSKDFVQLGDKFIYVGSQISSLSDAMAQQALAEQQLAAAQLQSELKLGEVAKNIADAKGEEGQDAVSYYTDLAGDNTSIDAKKAAVADFFGKAIEGAKAGDVDILKFLTDAEGDSLGYSANGEANISGMSEAQLNEVLQSIARVSTSDVTQEETQEAIRQAAISKAMIYDDYETNIQNARANRGSEESKIASNALIGQAATSGVVNEAVLSEYKALIEKENLTADEQSRIAELEDSISASMKTVIKNQAGLQARADIINRVADAIEQDAQKEIDAMQDIADATEEMTQQLLEKMQEQIDDQRKAREEEKQLQNLTDMESRLAYLRQDTSGGNALEIAQLEQELAQSREDYQNTLIDNQMNKLNDAATKAAEQRQQQITLAQQQLDWNKQNGVIMQQAAQVVNSSFAEVINGVNIMDTEVGRLLTSAEAEGLSAEDRAEWENDLNTSATTIANDITAADKSQDVADELEIETSNTKPLPTIESNVSALHQNLVSEQDKATKRDEAVNAVATAIANDAGSYSNLKKGTGSTYQEQLDKYMAAGGTEEQFKEQVRLTMGAKHQGKTGTNSGQIDSSGNVTHGILTGVTASGVNDGAGNWDEVKVSINGSTYTGQLYKGSDTSAPSDAISAIGNSSYGAVYLGKAGSDSALYVKTKYHEDDKNKGVRKLCSEGNENSPTHTEAGTAGYNYLNKFETGGLADFTGPAWLDGTKSRPELVLNARDTENFIQLKDILAHVMDRTTSTSDSSRSGDNYYEIEINVDSLENDYDVEQLADKIRSMIYNDATRRNVNVLGQKT